jgi:hypothetical protein
MFQPRYRVNLLTTLLKKKGWSKSISRLFLLVSQPKNGRPDLAFQVLERIVLHLHLSEWLKSLRGVTKYFHNAHASLAESDDNFIAAPDSKRPQVGRTSEAEERRLCCQAICWVRF